MLIEEPMALSVDPILAILSIVSGGTSRRIRQGIYEIGHFGGSHFLPDYESYDLDLPIQSCGVCDNVEQILAACPELLTSDRRFVICVHTIRKSTEPEDGGWRWHKWGPYIGTLNPQCEYLAHEPEIEQVMTFHIYEKKPAKQRVY